jgi:hypothetical protein
MSKVTTKQQLQDFESYLLEKEMMMCEEISKDCTKDFYDGAFTWINAIRREFKERFLND